MNIREYIYSRFLEWTEQGEVIKGNNTDTGMEINTPPEKPVTSTDSESRKDKKDSDIEESDESKEQKELKAEVKDKAQDWARAKDEKENVGDAEGRYRQALNAYKAHVGVFGRKTKTVDLTKEHHKINP